MDEVFGEGGAEFGGVAREFFQGGLDFANKRAGRGELELVETAFEFDAPAAVGEGAANGNLVAVFWCGRLGGGAEFAVPMAAETMRQRAAGPVSPTARGPGAKAASSPMAKTAVRLGKSVVTRRGGRRE